MKRALTYLIPLLSCALAAGCTIEETVAVDDDDGSSSASGSGSGSGGSVPVGPDPIAVLGGGEHSMDAVTHSPISNGSEQLNRPTDLAFNPAAPNELWIVNQTGESVTIIFNPGETNQTSVNKKASQHFMARPAALAFGNNGHFATIHEQDGFTQPDTPFDFMGPTLWQANSQVFQGQHQDHVDMLHNSPNGMGIAWEEGNTYWIFDGMHSSLTRYAFNGPHMPGGTDHSNGDVRRFVTGEVQRVANVPSHMWFDQTSRKLYVNDTGNHRVAVLDTNTGNPGGAFSPNYDNTTQTTYTGGVLSTFIDTSQYGNHWPSGMARFGDHLYVSDVGNGTIYGYTMDGELADWLPTGLPDGSLLGITFDASGNLYYVDAAANQIFRVSPK
jgi:hypothetical protein